MCITTDLVAYNYLSGLECWTWPPRSGCRIEIVMLMSKRNLNFNNKMETKCFSSHLHVFELVLPLLFKGVCVSKKDEVLSLPSPFWKGSETNFVNKISSSMLIITVQPRHWVKGRVICSPLGIAFGIGKESFIFPGCRGRLFPPNYPSSFPVSTFFPFHFYQ